MLRTRRRNTMFCPLLTLFYRQSSWGSRSCYTSLRIFFQDQLKVSPDDSTQGLENEHVFTIVHQGIQWTYPFLSFGYSVSSWYRTIQRRFSRSLSTYRKMNIITTTRTGTDAPVTLWQLRWEACLPTLLTCTNIFSDAKSINLIVPDKFIGIY